MAQLVAIGYPDETTAFAAEQTAEALASDLIIQPDAIAVIVHKADGKWKTETNHHAVAAGATWGLFWGFLFGLLFFIPFLGLALGAGMGAIFGALDKNMIDKEFQSRVREMLQPGTSALFLVVEEATWDKASEALAKHGGTILQSSLSKEAEDELQGVLHGKGEAAAEAPAEG